MRGNLFAIARGLLCPKHALTPTVTLSTVAFLKMHSKDRQLKRCLCFEYSHHF